MASNGSSHKNFVVPRLDLDQEIDEKMSALVQKHGEEMSTRKDFLLRIRQDVDGELEKVEEELRLIPIRLAQLTSMAATILEETPVEPTGRPIRKTRLLTRDVCVARILWSLLVEGHTAKGTATDIYGSLPQIIPESSHEVALGAIASMIEGKALSSVRKDEYTMVWANNTGRKWMKQACERAGISLIPNEDTHARTILEWMAANNEVGVDDVVRGLPNIAAGTVSASISNLHNKSIVSPFYRERKEGLRKIFYTVKPGVKRHLGVTR